MGYQPSLARSSESSTFIHTPKDILEYFLGGCKKPADVRIGMEVEKHGIHKSTRAPVTYLEQNGVRKIQEKMLDELNWKIERQEEKYITSMSRGGSYFSLEYYESQSELSGRTHPSIHDLSRELRIHQHELSEMSKPFDVVWLGIGYDPFHKDAELRRVRLKRFDVLDALKKKNDKEHWGRICSIQANIDYCSDDDARKKFQVLLLLNPFLSAMYAHSPLKEGKNTGMVSYRMHVLQQIKQKQYGFEKTFFDKNFSFATWIDYCLKLPMVAILREGQWMPVKKTTFAQFLKSGYSGFAATLDDWILHVSFIYTDVRIKQYIELRMCDSLPPFLIPSMQAIVKAFVYHPDGEHVLRKLTKGWKYHEFVTLLHEIAHLGMYAEIRGKKILDYCKELLEVATANLRSFKVLNEKEQDESVHLEPIKEFVFVKEKSPGRYVMDSWDGDWHKNPDKLIDWCSFESFT